MLKVNDSELAEKHPAETKATSAGSSITTEDGHTTIVEALTQNSGVTFGSQGQKGFGPSALKVNNKIFAMLDSRGKFVVKLPRQRVDSPVSAGEGERFDPVHGRLMKEWLAVSPTSKQDWLELAKEDLAFVASQN